MWYCTILVRTVGTHDDVCVETPSAVHVVHVVHVSYSISGAAFCYISISPSSL